MWKWISHHQIHSNGASPLDNPFSWFRLRLVINHFPNMQMSNQEFVRPTSMQNLVHSQTNLFSNYSHTLLPPGKISTQNRIASYLNTLIDVNQVPISKKWNTSSHQAYKVTINHDIFLPFWISHTYLYMHKHNVPSKNLVKKHK